MWDKPSKVADVGKEEFIAFSNDLKDRVRKIKISEHASEHKDHLHWNSEHEFWLDEIDLWKKDHQLAIDNYMQLK